MGIIFNSTTTERELGTLETLLVSPASRGELLTGKLLLVLLCGILTAGLNIYVLELVVLYLGGSLALLLLGPGTISFDAPIVAGLIGSSASDQSGTDGLKPAYATVRRTGSSS